MAPPDLTDLQTSTNRDTPLLTDSGGSCDQSTKRADDCTDSQTNKSDINGMICERSILNSNDEYNFGGISPISNNHADSNDLDALRILNRLDNMLDQSMSIHTSQHTSSVEDFSDASIEKCLWELDTYLQDMDSSGSEEQDATASSGEVLIAHFEDDIDLLNQTAFAEEDKNNPAFLKTEEIETSASNKQKRRAEKPLSAGYNFSSIVVWNPTRALSDTPETSRLHRSPEGSMVQIPDSIDWNLIANFSDTLTEVDTTNCLLPCSMLSTLWNNDFQATCTTPNVPDVVLAEDIPIDREVSKVRTNERWLRSSMRRTCPLMLPEENEVAETLGMVDALCEEGTVSEVAPPFNTEEQSRPRPASAPARHRTSLLVEGPVSRFRSSFRSTEMHAEEHSRARSSSASSRSRRAPSLISTDSSIETSVDSSCADSPENTNIIRACADPEIGMEHSEEEERREIINIWPHSISPTLACLACSLGLFNVSRFAVLSIHFGAPFVVQFMVLSLCLGIPLFTLQICLGHQMRAGPMDMWRVSPIFQGVGIALVAAHAFLGIYTIMPVSWMFTYFRDSFITKMDKYRWAEPFELFKDNQKPHFNGSYKLHETVADYFNGVVLQRHHLRNSISSESSDTGNGTIKFQLAFNLAVAWLIIFVAHSKGLRSYGKALIIFSLIPVLGLLITCIKFMTLLEIDKWELFLPSTPWDEFFLNTKSWIAASQEAFLTWGLLGAAVMQASSQGVKRRPRRDAGIAIALSITALLLSALIGNACVCIMKQYGYDYHISSFERISTYSFLRPSNEPLPPSLANTPTRFLTRTSLVVGERASMPVIQDLRYSGYQAVRLATELLPVCYALLGPEQVSPFWSVLSYFTLILLGISQQLAIWYYVVSGMLTMSGRIKDALNTMITFLSCAAGFLLGLPMTTEGGIFVIYFLDYCIGGAWWITLLYLLQIAAIFLVRGRPYSGDTIVKALCPPRGPCVTLWAAPILSFTWNVILPIALMVLCITGFKNGSYKELYQWRHHGGYWPIWARQIGAFLQLTPLHIVPLAAIIQTYRYLSSGSPDILDRFQLLYRPPLGAEHLQSPLRREPPPLQTLNSSAVAPIVIEDSPPKYTPPPSYTTATGARIAYMLRQSIRRSMRRITNVFVESNAPPESEPPPPDYASVLVEMRSPIQSWPILNRNHESQSRENPRRSAPTTSANSTSPLTAADVAHLLRSSLRRSTRVPMILRRIQAPHTSAENLVPCAAPIAETPIVLVE